MLDKLFRDKKVQQSISTIDHPNSNLAKKAINRLVPTIWSEHCLECSPPQCYQSCEIYKRRKDGRCIRLSHGIIDLNNVNSAGFDRGLLCFRRWAKIECTYTVKTLTQEQTTNLYKTIRFIERIANGIIDFVPGRFSGVIQFVGDALYSLRRRLVLRTLAAKGEDAKQLCLWIAAQADRELSLIIELRNSARVFFRSMVCIYQKNSEHLIRLPIMPELLDAVVAVYPEETNEEHNITFNALEVLDYIEIVSDSSQEIVKDQKIKCVVWDLDNTLWQGILVEGTKVVLDHEIVKQISALDSRGIVNSICSKNDYDAANQKLIEIGVREYFVFPRINWKPKSTNLKEIASAMNISMSSIAFVDDSPAERGEVKMMCPEVMVIDVHNVHKVLKTSSFNAAVSDESKGRRLTYQMMERQQADHSEWHGDNDAFLLTCNMRLKISAPEEIELKRCHELVQRTNQLNISGRALAFDELISICHLNEQDCFVLRCEDQYGDYGIVGFAVVNISGPKPIISDMFISCRVANRKVEIAFFLWLFGRYSNAAKTGIGVKYKNTQRNTPIRIVLEQVIAVPITTDTNEVMEYTIDADRLLLERQVVQIIED